MPLRGQLLQKENKDDPVIKLQSFCIPFTTTCHSSINLLVVQSKHIASPTVYPNYLSDNLHAHTPGSTGYYFLRCLYGGGIKILHFLCGDLSKLRFSNSRHLIPVGTPDPFSIPAAFRIRNEAGGVLST